MGPPREPRPGDRGESETPSKLSENPWITAGASWQTHGRHEGCPGEGVAGDGGKWRFASAWKVEVIRPGD